MNLAHNFCQPDDRGLRVHCLACGRANRLGYERLGHEFRCGHCKSALPQPKVPVDVPHAATFASLISLSALPVLVDFWAPWCGPCKMVAPELVKVAAAGAGRWLVAKVNTEELPDLAARFNIRGIPTLILFRGGVEVARQSGALPAAAILQFTEQYL
ncbi:MAG TPA: thioredoxin [Verrucomicrobiae bacterium]